MAISGGWITPKNDLELPLRGLFRIFSLIASRWKERNQHYCYLFYQNLLNHGCYRHSRKIMTYKDNLKTDLIILFKNEQMNINEAKKLDHILWPYYPYTTIKLCQLFILFRYCLKCLKAVVGFIFYNVLLSVFLWFEENKKSNFN